MAVWHSASIKTNTSSLRMLRIQLEVPYSDAYDMEPDNSGKWHPAAKIAFVVASCALLWVAIFAAIAFLF